MTEHKIRKGECISSIAMKHGFFPATIWNDPANTELKRKRGNPNVLHKGDVVIVRERELKEESCATEERHRFRRKGVPETFRIRLLDEFGRPRTELAYLLEIDGISTEGVTDSNGELFEPIPPNASSGKLLLGEERNENIALDLGGLDPVSEVSGVQARLRNLGFACGRVDGKLGPQTQKAIREFQAGFDDLEETGELDKATEEKLEQAHGH